jgi:2-polyprenyl-3-methyl-5-hydroxy-6-metoxy-1,4-benzoquinol methylase
MRGVLLPDRLRALWGEVEAGRVPWQDFEQEKARALGEYRDRWKKALVTDGGAELRPALLAELGAYFGGVGPAEVARRCEQSVATLRHEWQGHVDPGQRSSVETFYESETTIYELTDWHTLHDDDGPLAYLLGLDIALERRVARCLDFGSGVGAGALVFGSAGIAPTLADISTTLLDFCRWRLERRAIAASFVDLKTTPLPDARFDMILAMDVFEHLVDPVETAERLWKALAPGGVLFARIHAEDDVERPHHIVRDFEPTFARMADLGLVEIWRDRWLWGHQLFEKRA